MSASTIASTNAWEGLRHRFGANRGMVVAIVIFAVMFGYYGYMQPVGLSSNVINTAANKGRKTGELRAVMECVLEDTTWPSSDTR